VSRFEHIIFAIKWKIFQKLLSQSKLLCFPCDFLNIQKWKFKKCPLTWVAPLIVFLTHATIVSLFFGIFPHPQFDKKIPIMFLASQDFQ
jgi:hypothetical protein